MQLSKDLKEVKKLLSGYQQAFPLGWETPGGSEQRGNMTTLHFNRLPLVAVLREDCNTAA